ncbi:MAG: ArsR family transcriptional regulator [Saprospiraceae bacterium]
MGTSKTLFFSKRINKTAVLCHALGHPARIAIVEILLKKNKLIANSIAKSLPLAQPTIAQHLKILLSAEILEISLEDSSVYYQIDKEKLHLLSNRIEELKSRLI